MLVLSRYRNEVITIGNDIRVAVAEIRGAKTRIRIEAPPEVSIYREELYEAIQCGTSRWQRTTIPMLAPGKNQGLILTRKTDEAIRIEDDIRLVIVEIRGDRVRIGIEAPRSVSVHRQEVYEKIKNENNPVAKAVASANSVTNVRSIATRTIVARKGVMPMP